MNTALFFKLNVFLFVFVFVVVVVVDLHVRKINN